MFRKTKKFTLPLAAMLILLISGVACASSPVKLFISGQEINTDVPPQTINGRVMVPVRVVSEYLGSTVNWDANNNMVYIQPNNNAKNTSNNTNINAGGTLTKEQKAEQLKAILTSSAQIVQGDIDPSDIGDSELHYANTYVNLHADYTKFNALFSEEFLNNENVTPALDAIDRAYVSALETVNYPGTPYDFGDPSQWNTRIPNNLKIVLGVFNKYISANGKYY